MFITGGSGFIGTNIVEYFIKEGYEILNVDIAPPRNPEHQKYWKKVDILQFDLLEKVLLDFCPKYVLHLAARTDLKGKVSYDYNVNTIGTSNLITVLNKVSSVKRVLFASSMLVCKPGYLPFHEIDYSPSTVYGESKVEMENIIRKSTQNYEWTIIRPTSIWGPFFKEPYKDFFQLIKNRKYFHIGEMSCTKTYGFIGNVIYQIEEIFYADISKVHSKIFYLGDYDPVNIEIWANEIAIQFGYKIHSLPFALIKLAALGGDLLNFFGIKFPMTSFRLKNMTTNNVIDLTSTQNVAPSVPYTRVHGIHITLNWMSGNL